MVNRLKIDAISMHPETDQTPVEWRISDDLIEYPTAVAWMEKRVEDIANGTAAECVWLLQHPPTYTAGTGAQQGDLLQPDRFPVYKTGRGGQYTYHGPGQRIAYVMLDLKRRKPDIRAFVTALESWIIETLCAYHINGERREDRVGVWVTRPERPPGPDGACEEKIAAIGIRLRKWVSFHGIAINIDPDLDHFNGIVPCGVAGHGVTSFEDLGLIIPMSEVDQILRKSFEDHFGVTVDMI